MELWSELFGTRHEPKQLSVNWHLQCTAARLMSTYSSTFLHLCQQLKLLPYN